MTEPSAAPPDPRSVPWRWIAGVLGLAVLVVVARVIAREAAHLRYADVMSAFAALPTRSVVLAVLTTILSFVLLPGYDVLALSYAQHALRLRKIAFASVAAFGISQTLGFAAVTGASVRARLWSAWGLDTAEITRAAAFALWTSSAGLMAMLGVIGLTEPEVSLARLRLAPTLVRCIAVLALAATLAYVMWCARKGGSIGRVRGVQVRIPPVGLVLRGLLLSGVDWCLAAAVLYVLLPAGIDIRFTAFVGLFLLAHLGGVISHVPGGLGVFEAILVLELGQSQLSGDLLATLLAYRTVYYFLPFIVAVVMLTARELGAHRRRMVVGVAGIAQGIGRWSEPLVPLAIGLMTMGGGAILLVSGATPALPSRVAALLEILPLGLLEVSHFTGSFVGAMLLLLGYALTRRLDAAWHLTRALLVIGIGATLLKGFDYEEALALGVVLLFLAFNREAFYRRSSLLAEPLTPEWIVGVVAIIGASVWVGIFSFKHVEYSADLWWRFAERGDVPRSLRASVGAVGAIVLVASARLLRQTAPRLAPPDAETLQRVRGLIGSVDDTTAALALIGDKQLLLSQRGTGFLMFGISGQSFIAMGDPYGTDEDRRDLGWQLRDIADAHGGTVAFYEVSAVSLPLCVDLGLTLLKIGESATVPLTGFTLDGGARRGLRRTQSSLTKLGATFEVVDATAVHALLPELRRISDDWLLSKSAREKGFSLGRFDPAYLVNFPMALIRIDGRLVCFANLFCGNGRELSPDLMRYSSDAPPSVMEFLFISLLLWGRDNGFAHLSLGMAPLAGLQSRRAGPLSQRLGAVVYRHGEHFYNFQGLRAYKEKFDPVWEPRYLACEGGLALPGTITNIASLISGGISGLVSR